MYCAQCHRPLFHKDLQNFGWCEECDTVVHVSRCKISFWMLTAVLTIGWVAQMA